MSGGRTAWLLPALAVSLAAAAPAPTVSLSELAHCAAIVAVDQRLACYDSLAAAALQPAAAAATTKAGAPVARSATTAAAPAVTAASGAPVAAGAFGMSTHAPPAEQATQLISARVASATADRLGNVFVVLDNGQTWTYLDATGPPQPGGEVTIRRASLGSYLLTAPSRHTFRAQRTQ